MRVPAGFFYLRASLLAPRVAIMLALGVLTQVPSFVHGEAICSFEEHEAAGIVVPSSETKSRRIQEHATDGSFSLECVFPGKAVDSWPGLYFRPGTSDLRGVELLEFDVWNPADRQVRLSWRVDDIHGKKEFGGISLKPRAMTTAEIYIKALSSKLDTAGIKQIFPYVRCPREDVTLYVDNFRFGTFKAKYRALTYRETEARRDMSEVDRDRGFALFQRHWMDTVFASSHPRSGEPVNQLQCFACPGEYEPVTFSVYSLRELREVSVTVSGLVSVNGSSVPGDAVSVYPVRGLNKRTTYSSKDYVEDLPVLLERRSSVHIAAETCQRFWLDIAVPVDTPAGIYIGHAEIRISGRSVATLPLRVRVLPFTLPPAPGMIWGEYYRGPALAKTTEETHEFVVRDLRDMREHGMTSVGLCIGIPTVQATYAEGRVSLNLDGTSLFEHFMDAYRDLGFPEPVVQLSDSGQAFASQQGLSLGSEAYAQGYKAFWGAVQDECRARNWAEIIVQPVDEPGWQDENARERNIQLLRMLKEIPGMRTEQDGPGDGYFHSGAGPVADIWNYNGGIASPEIVSKAQNDGHTIMLYNCDVESYRPEVQRYVAGFFQRRAGISGCYNWAYTSFSGSPYDDLDYKTGTWMHVYPAWNDEVGGPSTGWQGFREGIDDYRYIVALKGVISRLRGVGTTEAMDQAEKSETTLQSLLGSLHYSPRVRSTAKWGRQWVDGDSTYITGQLKTPTGWDFSAYDSARWQLADATLQCLALLGDIPLPAKNSPQRAVPSLTDRLSLRSWQSPHTVEPRKDAGMSRSQLGIPQCSAPPEVDGRLSKNEWEGAAHITDFHLSKGGKPQAGTEAWLGMDTHYLYIAFRCEEPYMDRLTAGVTEDGGPVWKDDCVEVFIDGNHDRETWRQVVVNCLGKHMVTRSDGDWSPDIQTAAVLGEDAWTVEIRIRREALGLSGLTFGLNLCRERRPMEVMELIAWSPTGNEFGRPDRFGVATLGTSVLTRACVSPPLVGENVFTAEVTNPSEKALDVKMILMTSVDDGPVTTVTGKPVKLLPGQGRTIEEIYVNHSDSGTLNIVCQIVDCETGTTIAEQPFSVSLQSACGIRVTPSSCSMDRDMLAVSVALRLSPSLRKTTRLYAELRAPGRDGASGKRQDLGVIKGDSALLDLNVLDLPAGTYSLGITLGDRESGRIISSSETQFTRLRGPFGQE